MAWFVFIYLRIPPVLFFNLIYFHGFTFHLSIVINFQIHTVGPELVSELWRHTTYDSQVSETENVKQRPVYCQPPLLQQNPFPTLVFTIALSGTTFNPTARAKTPGKHPERVPPNGNWNLTTVHSLVFTMQVCIRASLKQLSLAVGLQSNMFASHLLPIRSGPLHLFDLIFHQSPSPLFPLSVEIFRTSGYLLFPPSGTFFSLSFPCLAHCHPSNLYKYHILRKASSDHTL